MISVTGVSHQKFLKQVIAVGTFLNGSIAQNIARLVFEASKILPIFGLHYLRTEYVQTLPQRRAKGNAVQDLQLGEMKKIPIFLPPIQSQERFSVACEKIEQLLEHNLGREAHELDSPKFLLKNYAAKGICCWGSGG
ncbi:hypothetical protein [Leptolyngbya sp. BC1307]|uniref:hypothetical protein n=1 Tax=Leptolyngbya sp. BC1307 TaxID=2029589 RepID=UPI001140C499|nr:hypothetical protein [Leptolyngbya sp. BC1307]